MSTAASSSSSPGGRSRPQVRPVAGASVDDLVENLIEKIEAARLDVDESELLDDPNRHRRSTLPRLDLPGFGEPEDDCGEYTPAGLYPCPHCGNITEFKHNCYLYDCPMHAPHAVRRRAAGSKSMPGVVAKLAACRAWLDRYFKQHHVRYHRLVFSPPADFFWRSDQPLERAFELIGELLRVFGAQGLVVYHPWAGRDGDDRGKWKQRLFSGREWRGDVREELVPRGHFHVYAVAHEVKVGTDDDGYALEVDDEDLDELAHDDADDGASLAGLVEDATGWVIKRIEPYDGSTVSIYDETDLARSVTYGLSHAGIYETPSGQRRLAARFKGPDINEVEVYEDAHQRNKAIVNDAAEDTLGILAPDLTCDRELSKTSVGRYHSSTGTISSDGASGASASTSLPNHSNADMTGEVIVGSSGPVDAASSVPTTSTTSTTTERCGGDLVHISQVDLELLTDLDDRGVDTRELERAYQDYKAYMARRGLTGDDRPDVPEFEDRPPPD